MQSCISTVMLAIWSLQLPLSRKTFQHAPYSFCVVPNMCNYIVYKHGAFSFSTPLLYSKIWFDLALIQKRKLYENHNKQQKVYVKVRLLGVSWTWASILLHPDWLTDCLINDINTVPTYLSLNIWYLFINDLIGDLHDYTQEYFRHMTLHGQHYGGKKASTDLSRTYFIGVRQKGICTASTFSR